MAFDNLYRLQALNRMRLEESRKQAQKAQLIAAARANGSVARKPVLTRVGNVLVIVGESLQARYGLANRKSVSPRPLKRPA